MKTWAISHVGMVRKINEDCFFVEKLPETGQVLLIVCDGMGGAKAGEVASKTAVVIVAQYVKDNIKVGSSLDELKDILCGAAAKANEEIWRLSAQNHEMEGMGTTLVAALASSEMAVVANIGDSRAYLLDDGGITQITTDHSLVSEMIKRGEISKSQAQKHPRRNVITRALGADKSAQCDIFLQPIKTGQFMLLCSDGLTGEVSEPEIFYEVCQSGTPENACQTLVEIANSRGGHDNITVVLASF